MRETTFGVVAALCGLLACTAELTSPKRGLGSVNGPSSANGQGTGIAATGGAASVGAAGGTQNGTGGASAPVDLKPGQIQARAWRLNKLNYLNSIKQIGLNPDPIAATFPDDVLGAPFIASNSLNVQQVLAQKYADAAEVLAGQAKTQGEAYFKQYASCSWQDAACAGTFISSLGRTLYRRPVSPEQLTRLNAIFAAGKALSGSEEGMRYVVQAMLQSPLFLYRTEVGPSSVAAGSGTLTSLTSFEVASLLSYMVTDAPPDAELSKAADADQLQSPAQIQAQFARLNKTPAAAEKTTAFLEGLLGVNATSNVVKDETLYPNSVAIQSTLQASFRLDARYLLDSTDPSWSAVMRLSSFAVNSVTANVFGIEGLSGMDFVRRDAPPTERKGMLTHPAVMASFSHAAESAPVFRGKMVLARLLCRPPGSPPANASTMLMADQLPATATRREVFDALIARPTCAGCHVSLNAIGFSLDNYDALGKFRTADSKGPLDVRGEVNSLRGEGSTDGATESYVGGVELAEKLAGSKVAKECVSLQSYRFYLGLPTSDVTFDLGTRADFVDGGAQLTQLASLISSSPNFKERVK